MNNYPSLTDHCFALLIANPNSYTSEQKTFLIKEYNEKGKDCFYAFATNKKILPFVAHALLELNLDNDDFWYDIHKAYVSRNQKVVLLLDDVFKRLNSKGCTRVCVTENFASVLSSDACIGCFSSGDIDLFVDKNDLDIVDAVMEEMGFQIGDRLKRKKNFAYEYYSDSFLEKRFWLNFQWYPLTRKKSHFYNQHRIIKRLYGELDKTVPYKNTSIKLLSHNALLYFNLHHIASGHFFVMSPEFRLYADIDKPISAGNYDLDTIINWSKEDKAGLRTIMVLYISNLFLNTPLDVPTLLKGVNVRRFNRLKRFLITSEYSTRKAPHSIVKYLLFLFKIEFLSDGTGLIPFLFDRFINLFRKY